MHPVWVVLIGFLVGTIGGFTGIGGGIIIVPALLLLGFSSQKAVGTSFLCVLLLSVSALFAHFRLENIDYKMGFFGHRCNYWRTDRGEDYRVGAY